MNEPAAQGMTMLFWVVAMFAIMYLFMIRPEQKRKKKAQEMRESLKKGDVVTTMGGIVGKIVHVKQDTIIVETSDDRVRLELTKWAVSSIGVQNTEEADDRKETKLNGASVADSDAGK